MPPETGPGIAIADLLETLTSHLGESPFTLSVQCRSAAAATHPPLTTCGALGANSLCASHCDQSRDEAMRQAISDGRPQLYRCPGGLLNFAIPLPAEPFRSCCLVGSGVRDAAASLDRLEALANAGSLGGEAILDRLERLPTASLAQAEETAATLHRLLPNLLDRNTYALALAKADRRLDAVADIAGELGRAASADALFTLLGEALTVLFDIGGVALLTPGDGAAPALRQFGHPLSVDAVALPRLREFLGRHPDNRTVTATAELDKLFPGATPAAVIPLAGGTPVEGLLALFAPALDPRDLRLAELLAGRAAARLESLCQKEMATRQLTLAERLAAGVATLALAGSRAELHRQTLALAAELLGAESGSLLLLDADGETLAVEAALGLSQPVARHISLKVGSGIAGRVARNGFPLLVTDIEKDSRTSTPNRPRYKTKSFLSVPVRLREQTIGVLNLADKADGTAFTETDLQLLITLSAHTGQLAERAQRLERTSQLEELSITDPLTNLFNRRFLEKRLEEELNRSVRQHLSFTVMLIDLDHFKIYNDRCGHLAGDQALRKTADLLRSSAREMDVVTRFGGEEFCVLLPGTSKKESILVAERIRRAVENAPFPREKELPLGRLTASIGIAAYPEDGHGARDLLDASDVALYQAKGAGRNRIALCDAALLTARAEVR